MQNIVYGIIALLLALVGYVLGILYFRKNKIGVAILCIVVAGLIIRIFSCSDQYVHNWDERYHALVAKHMMDDPFHPMLITDPVLPYDYKNWTANHIWLHKPPLALWIMAGSMKIFGMNEWALRIPSIVFSLLGIILCFLIGKKLFNIRVGFWAALFFSMNGLLIDHTAGRAPTDHIDLAFMFFILLSVWWAILFAQSKKYIFQILCGITIGLAILTKWLPALIVLPIWICVMLHFKTASIKYIFIQFLMLTGITVSVFLPWQIYIYQVFPMEALWENSYNYQHITNVVEERSEPFYYYFVRIGSLFGWLAYLPLGWFIYKCFRNIGNWKYLAIFIWIMVPYVFFSMVKTKMPSYILFTLPAISLVIGYFIDTIQHAKKRIMIVVLGSILFLLPAGYTIERMKIFDIIESVPEWKKEILSFKNNTSDMRKTVFLNVPRPVEMMFYLDCIAYNELPAEQEIVKLRDKGFEIFINDNGNLNPAYSLIEGIHLVKINNRPHLPVPITKWKRN